MKIAINHLTRMAPGYVCVAGLDAATGRHVRPVLGGRLPVTLLAANGGVFEMGSVVDLGRVTPTPRAPEVEDHVFTVGDARSEGQLPAPEFWRRLQLASQVTFAGIFGPELRQRGAASCAVDAGKGVASLGVLNPVLPPTLSVRGLLGESRKIRLQVSDGQMALNLSVTDVRFFQADRTTPDEATVDRANRRIASGEQVLLSVGLTRAFTSSQDLPPVHWLQINNVHFARQPLWRVGEALN